MVSVASHYRDTSPKVKVTRLRSKVKNPAFYFSQELLKLVNQTWHNGTLLQGASKDVWGCDLNEGQGHRVKVKGNFAIFIRNYQSYCHQTWYFTT